MNESKIENPTALSGVENREAKKTFRRALACALTVSLLALAGSGCSSQKTQTEAKFRPATFCNPLNLDYRFQLDPPSRREAADPTMVCFKGEYWLFASKSGGYWHSRDLNHWDFIRPTGLPLEDYAPTVEIIGGKMYFTAFGTRALFTTDDPLAGAWTKVADLAGYADPALFADDDGRVYLYYGCSRDGTIQGVELDPANHFKVVRGPVTCLVTDYAHHGWEVTGEANRGDRNDDGSVEMAPYTEGAWMNKHNGIYYLQYSAPGTQFRTYADGVYTATQPLGPFTYAPYSPFSHKPTGFAAGAGHSSTMADVRGQFWHITTMSISVRHMFERRLGLFAVGFLPDGQMFANTYLGDFPQFAPGVQPDPARDNFSGWMLLSYRKPATASSTDERFPVTNAFDEDIRTWWSATSGKAGEWLQVDLGKICRLDALQINFADQGATQLDRLSGDAYRYYVETSTDGKTWQTCLDRRDNTRDLPHDYTPLDQPVRARYARLVNVHMPAGANFSISGFRLFGNGLGKTPAQVKSVTATLNDGHWHWIDSRKQVTAKLNPQDPRQVHVSWPPVANADFYIIRYGLAPDRLFNNYQVHQTNAFDISSLNLGAAYWFTVDTVNDSGVTPGPAPRQAR